ncbi:hypothetical protein [Clostridium perfringens]|uniref:hypothetical protein n=1 Tax=Clostridium perfringens TaxID=1502 RepID=UPI0018E423A7|nr:hypothetical protein [Clostridium perfringens]MBI6054524.1 hypothetical protein [Clostridium perfringens]UCR75243.1 hypothetical protein BG3P_29 [Clostridium phage vB_CpeS_BG3P]
MEIRILKKLLNKTLTVQELINFLKNEICGEGDESIVDNFFFYTIDEDHEIKIKFTSDFDGILDEEDRETILNTEINIIKVEIIKLD